MHEFDVSKFTRTKSGTYVCEASSLGLAVGHVPQSFYLNGCLPNGGSRVLRFCRTEKSRGETVGWIYGADVPAWAQVQLGVSNLVVKIFND